MVSLAMSAGTPEHALSSFAFLREAEAPEGARTFWFWVSFGECVAFHSENRQDWNTFVVLWMLILVGSV